MKAEAGSAQNLSWQVLLKLRGETPRWDRKVLQEKLQEVVEFLSRTMAAEVLVLAVVSDPGGRGKGPRTGAIGPEPKPRT